MARHRLLVSSLVLFALSAPALAQQWFEGVQLHTDPDAAVAIAVLDVDHDGDPDLLRGTGTALRVAVNDGVGSFVAAPLLAPIQGPYLSAFSDQPPAITADIDGDGRADLVYAPDGTLLGAGGIHSVQTVFDNGTSTLGVPASFALGAFPTTYGAFGVCAADLDGDGRAELGVVEQTGESLFTTYTSRARWLDWNGASFVSSATLSLVGQPSANPPGDVDGLNGAAAIDWNGDGTPDLVSCEWLNPFLVWMPTQSGAPVSGGKFALPFTSRAVQSADMDGDGQADLLTLAQNLQNVQFAVVRGGPGAWTANASPALGQPLQASWDRELWTCDWDADGDLDVVLHTSPVSGNEGALFVANDGNAGLAQAAARVTDSTFGYVGGSTLGNGAGPADYDQDGHVDLALSRAVLYGNGSFPLETPGPYAAFPPGFRALDLEGDGDLDAIAVQGVRGTSNGVQVGPVGASKLPPLGPGVVAATVGIGDFDGDGRIDEIANLYSQTFPFVPAIYLSTHLYLDIGKGQLVDIGVCTSAEVSTGHDFGGYPQLGRDFDGDGDLDLLTPTGLWIKTSLYSFGTYVSLFAPDASAVISDVADVDGDGDLDFIRSTGSGTGGVVTNTLHRDQGGFSYTSELLLADVNLDEYPRFLDLDDDGDLDLVTGYDLHSGSTLTLHENQGGSLVLATTLAGTQGQIDCYGIDDVDGDGLSDLLCAPREAAYEFGLLSAYRRSGAFTYEAPRRFLTRHVREFVDVDSDGDIDALGNRMLRGHREHGPGSGVIRQYGSGSLGSLGVVPVLGASGPLQTGHTNGELRVVNALGGAAGVLVVGKQESALAGIPFVGGTLYTSPILFTFPIQLGGPAGLPALGTLEIPIAQLAGLIGGLTFYHQVGIVDPGAPSGLALTAGLAVTYGN
jgi:hypothetical protein